VVGWVAAFAITINDQPREFEVRLSTFSHNDVGTPFSFPKKVADSETIGNIAANTICRLSHTASQTAALTNSTDVVTLNRLP